MRRCRLGSTSTEGERHAVGVLEDVIVTLALAVFAGVPLLIMLAEGRKAFAFLAMFVGFGLAFVARVIGFLYEVDPSGLHVMGAIGHGLAALAFFGYFLPRIRPKLGDLGRRFGISFRGRDDRDGVPPPATESPPKATEGDA